MAEELGKIMEVYRRAASSPLFRMIYLLTISAVSMAIMSSSLVGISSTFTLESAGPAWRA